jgi:transposase
MKKISKDTENNIISLLDKGLSSCKIAVQLGISHSTVMRECARLQLNAQKKKAGQPAKLTIADKRNIVRNLTSGKADTAVQLAKDLKSSAKIEISPDTVCCALKEAGLKAVTKKKKPCLKPRHIHQHLKFALQHQH